MKQTFWFIFGVCAGATALTMFQADEYKPGTIGILSVLWLMLMATNVGAFLILCDRKLIGAKR